MLDRVAVSAQDAVHVGLKTLRAVVGDDHVQLNAALEAPADPYAFQGDETILPVAVVRPASVEEVQAVLAEATKHRIPLWTVSRGRNFGYGGASPCVSGSVVLDLSRMNRVLEVDDDCGSVLLEPGVSFLDLHAHLRAIGSRLMPSVPDIGWGSVVGNALERGVGYAGMGDHSAQQCGLEVVLADGQIVRTGMGAKAGSNIWSLYKGGYGPSVDGLFHQSGMGVVTKMGLWLMPRPDRTAACGVKVDDAADLAVLVDAMRELMLKGVIQTPVIVGNAPVIASMISERSVWHDKETPIDEAGVRRMMAGLGLGFWNARFGLYGSAEMVEARIKDVRRALETVPSAELTMREYDGDVDPAAVHPADWAQLGIPSIDLVRMAAWRGGDPAHTDFSLLLPPVGREIERFVPVIRDAVEARGFDYAGGVTLFPRHAIALALISFDKGNAAQRQAVSELFPSLIAQTGAMGAAPYRSHTAFMDTIADQYDFGDHSLLRLQQRLKDTLDPSGILSAGKQGVWPRHLRSDP